MEPMIDLREYESGDVAYKVACEFLRNFYLDTIEEVVKNEKEDERKAGEEFLKSLEHVIFVLEGSDDFLKYVNDPANQKPKSDDPFDQ